jgi:predicted nucleotidyltransferase
MNERQYKTIAPSLLDEITRRIVDLARPEKIVLFGSQGRGTANEQSDIDLLVVAASDQPRPRRSVPLYLALSDILLPMDILVYTAEEVEEWQGVSQAFVTTALREGKVLYEKPA